MKEKYEFFQYEVTEDGIAVLTVNRPRVKNAMNTESWNEFMDFLNCAQTDDNIRVIIITGCGDSFIAGADVSEMVGAPVGKALLSLSQKVAQTIETGNKPVIAAVNGVAFGGGFEIALAADIRIITENAIFGLPESGLGLVPGMGGTQHLCKVVGSGRAKEVLLAGKNIRAAEAVNIGLAMKCVSPEELIPEALKVARKMLSKGPKALALIKKLVNAAYSTDDSTGLLLENLAFCALMKDWEGAEGVDAFLNKRKPEFDITKEKEEWRS